MLLLLLACQGPAPKDAPADSPPPDDSTPVDSRGDSRGDSGSDSDSGGPAVLPSACEAPSPLPDDPLTRAGQLTLTQEQPGQFFVELIDLEWEGDRVWAVGQGGLMIYDVADPSAPRLLGVHPEPRNGAVGRYHRVERLGDTHLALTHRDLGMAIVDVQDPTAPREVFLNLEVGLEGLAAWGDHLAVTVRGEGLRVYEVSDPAAPALVGAVAGLEAPWELSAVVEGRAFVADNVLGVVPVDLRDPTAPALGTPLALEGATLHVSAEGQRLYASQGSAGVFVLDASAPEAPTVLGRAWTGGSAVMAHGADGRLWVVDHEGLSVFDLADPTRPAPLAHELTEQFALAVRAAGTRAWVGDWNNLSGWDLDPGAQAPALDPSTDLVILPTEGGDVDLTLHNRGGATLTLAGGVVDEPSVALSVSALRVPPGGSATLTLSWPGGEALDATLCLASDDPDQSVLELPVAAGRVGEHIGRPAPDFELSDLDGQRRRLSDHLGQPVLLAYFATW